VITAFGGWARPVFPGLDVLRVANADADLLSQGFLGQVSVLRVAGWDELAKPLPGNKIAGTQACSP